MIHCIDLKDKELNTTLYCDAGGSVRIVSTTLPQTESDTDQYGINLIIPYDTAFILYRKLDKIFKGINTRLSNR